MLVYGALDYWDNDIIHTTDPFGNHSQQVTNPGETLSGVDFTISGPHTDLEGRSAADAAAEDQLDERSHCDDVTITGPFEVVQAGYLVERHGHASHPRRTAPSTGGRPCSWRPRGRNGSRWHLQYLDVRGPRLCPPRGALGQQPQPGLSRPPRPKGAFSAVRRRREPHRHRQRGPVWVSGRGPRGERRPHQRRSLRREGTLSMPEGFDALLTGALGDGRRHKVPLKETSPSTTSTTTPMASKSLSTGHHRDVVTQSSMGGSHGHDLPVGLRRRKRQWGRQRVPRRPWPAAAKTTTAEWSPRQTPPNPNLILNYAGDGKAQHPFGAAAIRGTTAATQRTEDLRTLPSSRAMAGLFLSSSVALAGASSTSRRRTGAAPTSGWAQIRWTGRWTPHGWRPRRQRQRR